jgi:hypothetical protein
MGHTRWNALFGQKARRVVLAGGLSLFNWGCHHHYYYYGTPTTAGVQGCPPGTGTTILPSAVATTGPICEVPADSVVGANSSRSTIVSDGRKSRVVVSEPSNSRSSYSWRPTDPDSPSAVTQVDGALDDSRVKK